MEFAVELLVLEIHDIIAPAFLFVISSRFWLKALAITIIVGITFDVYSIYRRYLSEMVFLGYFYYTSGIVLKVLSIFLAKIPALIFVRRAWKQISV